MGNIEILKRGDVQLTSAGTGILHSKKAHEGDEVHFLRIWSLSATARLQPKYFTHRFTNEEKADEWAKIVAPVLADGVKNTREGEGPPPEQTALTLYALILGTGEALSKPLEGKKAYMHVIQALGHHERQATGASVKFSAKGGDEVESRERDGAYVDVM